MGIEYFLDGTLGALPEMLLDTDRNYGGDRPEITRLASGGFVVTWYTDQKGFTQIYDSGGERLGEPQEVTGVWGSSTMQVAGLASGGYVLLWEVYNSPTGTHSLKAQIYNADGMPTGTAFTANQRVEGGHQQSIVTALPDGSFVIGWIGTYHEGPSYDPASSVTSVEARIFDSIGNPITDDLSINKSHSYSRSLPQAVALGDGTVAFTWSAPFDQEGEGTVHIQLMSADGVLADEPIRIPTSLSQNWYSSVAAVGEDRFVVTWTSEIRFEGGTRQVIRGQVFDSAGTSYGVQFEMAHGANKAGQAEVVATQDGFTVIWWSDTDTGVNYSQRGDVYAQRFDVEGQSLGAEFRVNDQTYLAQDLPEIADTSTGFAAIWRSAREASGDDIALRVFGQVQQGTDFDDVIQVADGYLILAGGEGADRLIGDAASNILDGGLGADTMRGGAGNDRYVVDDAGDLVVERVNEGRDRVYSTVDYRLTANVEDLVLDGSGDISGTGNALDNIITGNDADNALNGTGGDDTLIGGLGNDRLTGGIGSDRMDGGVDDDFYSVDNFGDVVIERWGGGFDTILATVDYTMGEDVEKLVLLKGARVGTGGFRDNIIIGSNGADRLSGLTGNDQLASGVGSDRLDGGAGDDTLTGGVSRDLLTGGEGADLFVFAEGDSSADRVSADRVLDFSRAEGDRVSLRQIDAVAISAEDDRFTFIGKNQFSGVAGELRFQRFGSETMALGDTDGDAVADFVIRFDGALAFVKSDFLL